MNRKLKDEALELAEGPDEKLSQFVSDLCTRDKKDGVEDFWEDLGLALFVAVLSRKPDHFTESTTSLLSTTLQKILTFPHEQTAKKCALSIVRYITDGGDQMDIWNDFCAVYETLDEPQAHIVSPVLPKLSSVEKAALNILSVSPSISYYGGICFCPSWLFLLFEKGMKHPNGWIRLSVIYKFTEISPILLSDPSIHQEVVKLIFNAVNDGDLFNRLNAEQELDKFVSQLRLFFDGWARACGPENYPQLSQCILKELPDIGWCPPAIYFVMDALSTMPPVYPPIQTDKTHVHRMTQMMSICKQLQVSQIRSAVNQLLLEVAQNTFLNFCPENDQMFLTTILPAILTDMNCDVVELQKILGPLVGKFNELDEIGKRELLEFMLDHLGQLCIERNWSRVVLLCQILQTMGLMVDFNHDIDWILSTIGDQELNPDSQPSTDHWLGIICHDYEKWNLLCTTGRHALIQNSVSIPLLIEKVKINEPGSLILAEWATSRKLFSPAEIESLINGLEYERCHTPDIYKLAFTALSNYDGLRFQDLGNVVDCLLTGLDLLSEWPQLKNVMDIIQMVISEVVSNLPHRVDDILNAVKSVCEEQERGELYSHALKAAFSIICRPELLDYHLSLIISRKVMEAGEKNVNLVEIFAEQLHLMVEKDMNGEMDLNSIKSHEEWCELMVECAVFGPVSIRNVRGFHEALQHISHHQQKYLVNFRSHINSGHNSVKRTRLYGIQMLQKLWPRNSGHIWSAIVTCSQKTKWIKSKSFGLSYSHRVTNRLAGLVLCLEGLCHDDFKLLSDIMNWAVGQLSEDAVQLSIRLLCEWLIVRILLQFTTESNAWRNFVNLQYKFAENRMGTVGSWLTILCHFVISVKNDVDLENTNYKNVLPMILGWCGGQHFAVRSIAHACVQTIISRRPDWCPSDDPFAKSIIENCIHQKLDNKNGVRFTEKLTKDFYFATFHPIRDYTFYNIFVAFAKHTGIPDDEWLDLPNVPGFPTGNGGGNDMNDRSKDLSGEKSEVWLGSQRPSQMIKIEESGDDVSFQKKLVPLNQVKQQILGKNAVPTTAKSKIILAASLIDKANNLGGLSRTCEIFGVDSMLIGNKKYLDDPNFKTLSVTSQNWFDIAEVRATELEAYVKRMRQDEGYRILGLEQTTNSIPLGQYQFHERTILIVGNEKEGIPPGLIALLDDTVEIPQFGMTRSLNVHVSTALVLWEWVKQNKVT